MSMPSTGLGKRGRDSPDLDAPVARVASAKKTHTEDSPVHYQRDEVFWFEDGSIFLIARDVEFRVYKRVLADHSTFFADMFSLPQPAPEAPSSDASECPVVHLEDSPEDLRRILRALLPRKSANFVQVDADCPSFDMISAYMRLGHKYQIDSLFDQSLAYLKKYFTSDFDTWYEWVSHNSYDIPKEWGDIYAAKLAIGVVLVNALAICCRLDAEKLVTGFKRADGTPERLSADDLKRCITGKRNLALAQWGMIMKAFTGLPMRNCPTKSKCRRTIQNKLDDLADGDPDFYPMDNPFCNWDSYVGDICDPDDALCDSCCDRLCTRIHIEQRKLWAELPRVIGISVEGRPKERTSDKGCQSP